MSMSSRLGRTRLGESPLTPTASSSALSSVTNAREVGGVQLGNNEREGKEEGSEDEIGDDDDEVMDELAMEEEYERERLENIK